MSLQQLLARAIVRLLLRIRIRGREHLRIPPPGAPPRLVVANHNAPLDWALLALLLPPGTAIALHPEDLPPRWLRLLCAWAPVIPVDPAGAQRELVERLRTQRLAATFPEGRPAPCGTLHKVREWPLLAAHEAGAEVVPVHIGGTQHAPAALPGRRACRHWLPSPSVTALAPQAVDLAAAPGGPARRQLAMRQLSDLLCRAEFAAQEIRQPLWRAVRKAARRHPWRRVAVADSTGRQVTYRRLLFNAALLGRALAPLSHPGEHVGVMLPTTVAGLTTFLALHASGRVPALLNFSAGAGRMAAACRVAAIRVVITSRQFVNKAQLEEATARLEREVTLVYLEDLRRHIGPATLAAAWLDRRLPRWLWRHPPTARNPDDTAVVLFTSGSEGNPKGVALSHANLLANAAQMGAVVSLRVSDLLLNVLPLFHAFGLTVATLLPLLRGVRLHLHPSPLEYHTIADLAYRTGATVMAGTDTFLAGYARAAHPFDFQTLRLLFAGAEPLKEETRRMWMEQLGIRVLEGYGTTETAPALAVNTPLFNRAATVGRMLPGVEWRLEPVAGLEQPGGRLWVKGPNIMRGYLQREGERGRPHPAGGLDPAGWYDTGDIVAVDGEGYITILGRAKRFAKIAGEMISLAAVEGLAARVWPDARHAVVTLPDPNRGERLVLVSQAPHPSREALLAQARRDGLSEIFLPRILLQVAEIPLLGSGKTDYPATTRLAEQLVTAKRPAAVMEPAAPPEPERPEEETPAPPSPAAEDAARPAPQTDDPPTPPAPRRTS